MKGLRHVAHESRAHYTVTFQPNLRARACSHTRTHTKGPFLRPDIKTGCKVCVGWLNRR